MVQKKLRCPKCKNIITINGQPGEKIFITCQKCNTKGKFIFPKSSIKTDKSDSSLALEINNLTKTFKGFKAVDDVTFSVKKGEIFGFLGPNGAGKTTTIKAILGLIHPDSGKIIINGYNIKQNEIEAKRSIGYLPERVSFYDNLNPVQTLQFFSELQGEDTTLVNKLLEEVGLNNALNRKVGGFSKGMLQLLGIAQTMIGKIPVYIFDEPMSGLDPRWVKIVRDMIIRLNQQGATIMFSSHILSEVQNLCDRVVIINKGKIIAKDTVENINKYLKLKPRIELTIPDLRGEIPKKIKNIEGILSIEINQDKLMITCNTSDRINIISEIKNQGFIVKDVKTIEPSLEEAFMKLITEDEEDN